MMFAPILLTHTPAMGLRSILGGLMSHQQLSRARSIDMLSSAGQIQKRDLDHWLTGGEHLTAEHSDTLFGMAEAAGADARLLSYRAVARMDDEDHAEPMEGEEMAEDAPTSYRFILSDAQPDRARDIVDQSWMLEDFNRNPVAPFGHDYSQPAVGTWRGVAVRNGVLSGRLIPFATESYPLSMTVAAQLAAKVLRTVSVGFLPQTLLWRADLPEGDPRAAEQGFVFINNHLIECSPVPVPMNPRALMRQFIAEQTRTEQRATPPQDATVHTLFGNL